MVDSNTKNLVDFKKYLSESNSVKDLYMRLYPYVLDNLEMNLSVDGCGIINRNRVVISFSGVFSYLKISNELYNWSNGLESVLDTLGFCWINGTLLVHLPTLGIEPEFVSDIINFSELLSKRRELNNTVNDFMVEYFKSSQIDLKLEDEIDDLTKQMNKEIQEVKQKYYPNIKKCKDTKETYRNEYNAALSESTGLNTANNYLEVQKASIQKKFYLSVSDGGSILVHRRLL